MSASQSYGRVHSHNLQPKTRIGTGVVLSIVFATLSILLIATPAHANLPLGLVQDPVPLSSCPGSGWYSYNTNHQMNCHLH